MFYKNVGHTFLLYMSKYTKTQNVPQTQKSTKLQIFLRGVKVFLLWPVLAAYRYVKRFFLYIQGAGCVQQLYRKCYGKYYCRTY